MQLRVTWEKAKALFLKKRLDREFDEELAGHLDLAIEEARKRGLNIEEARREARLRLGGIECVKDLHRETRGAPMIETILRDLTYGARTLRKTPLFTVVIVASLALGIGANIAVFTLINAALLRALPVPNAEELVSLEASPVLSFPMYRDLRDRQQVFTDIFASTREWQVRVTFPGSTDSTVLDNVPTAFVTANYFSVLRVQPQLGRFFTEQEDQNPESTETQGSVAVLSDGFWARQFGRDPAILNRVIYVNRSPCRIVGVVEPAFSGEQVANITDIWVPLRPFSPRTYLETRGGQFTRSVARLRRGISLEQAQSSMSALYQQLLAAQWNQYPETRPRDPRSIRTYVLRVTPAATGLDSGLRGTFSRPLKIVMAIVAVVLLVACANVANLLLARCTWRQREFSLRLALGCGRGRLIRQLLIESLLLASMGAAAGGFMAYWGSRTLLLIADAGPVDLRPDATVLGFAITIAVLTAIGFGIAPALRAGRVDLSSGLSEQGRGNTGGYIRQRFSRTLVSIQVALSLMLLIGSGLLIRSIYNLREVDLGFRPERVLIFDIAHNPQSREPLALARVARHVHARVRQIPGIRSVSLSRIQLFGGSDLYLPVRIRDYPASREEPVNARFNSVSPGYIETVGMTTVEGRSIQEQDTDNAPLVAVVNQSMARKYLPLGGPLGRIIEIPWQNMAGKPIQIVGVVRDAKYNDLRAEIKPMLYLSILQFPTPVRAIEVRTTEVPSTIAAAVRRAVLDITPDLMIRRVVPLSEQVDRTLRAERLITSLCVVFGVITLLLASIGLYGVMSYGVAQRTSEIGIRMALGATRAGVLWMILRQSAFVVVGGVIAGIALAVSSARLVTSFLYGLTPTDISTIAGATLVLLLVAAAAAYLPARRATRVDPMVALRHE